MIGLQSPFAELQLAKAIREDDIRAAERYRLARVARKHRREARKTVGGGKAAVPAGRSARPSVPIGSRRQPSG